jgi:soluble P-type ATPase
MLSIAIPGLDDLAIEHLVLDFNGTIACDGRLLEGVEPALRTLSERLTIHVVTADTFGTAVKQLTGLPTHVTVLAAGNQHIAKRDFVRALGPDVTACIGNGRNDRLMLAEAAMAIAVVLGEGAAVETVLAADVVATDIVAALDLLVRPDRLIATLRS